MELRVRIAHHSLLILPSCHSMRVPIYPLESSFGLVHFLETACYQLQAAESLHHGAANFDLPSP